MSSPNSVYNKIYSIYRNQPDGFAREHTSLEDLGIVEEMVASIFTPGEYFYAVFDWTRMELEMWSDTVTDLFGIEKGHFSSQFVVSRYHPDDIPGFMEREKKAVEFLFKFIKKEDILHYKVSQCMRLKTKDGRYRLFLSQSLTITVDDEWNIGKTFNVFSDISFVTKVNNQRISFIGLNGRPSFMNIDPKTSFSPTSNTYKLSPRELEVVQLIAEGHSNKSIGDYLKISSDTVRTHRNSILKKTELKTTSELVATLIKEGLV